MTRWRVLAGFLAAVAVGGVSVSVEKPDGVEAMGDLRIYLATTRVWADGGDPRRCDRLQDEIGVEATGCALSSAWLTPAFLPLKSSDATSLAQPAFLAGAVCIAVAAAGWTASAVVPWRAVLTTLAAAWMLRTTLVQLSTGNLEPLVVAALGVGAAAPRLRGAMIGLAGALKVFPWAIGLGRHRLAVAVSVALVLVTDLLIEGTILLGPRHAAQADRDAIQPTLLGLLRHLRGTRELTDALDLAAWAVIAVPALLLLRRRMRDADADRRYLVACLALLVLVPRGWHYIWLGAVPLVARAWADRPVAMLGLLGLLLPASLDPWRPWAVSAVTLGLLVAPPLPLPGSRRAA